MVPRVKKRLPICVKLIPVKMEVHVLGTRHLTDVTVTMVTRETIAK